MSSESIGAPRHASGDDGLHPFADVEGTLLDMQSMIGRKWILVIVYHLLCEGPLGFSALKDRIDGISSKMLSESLDAAEGAGLVEREVVSDRPVRVEYTLTDRGAALEGLIGEMAQWGTQYHPADADGEGVA